MLPEMWKTRPVLVISYKNMLNGPCLVAAISTAAQLDRAERWAHELSLPLEPGVISFVVCNHIYTVSPSRLSQFKGDIPRLDEPEFNIILAKVLDWLPKLPVVSAAKEASEQGAATGGGNLDPAEDF
jgi:mRNA interferase MazF